MYSKPEKTMKEIWKDMDGLLDWKEKKPPSGIYHIEHQVDNNTPDVKHAHDGGLQRHTGIHLFVHDVFGRPQRQPREWRRGVRPNNH